MLTAIGWAAIVVLIGANAVFVAAEFALTSVDRAQVRRGADSGDVRAARVLSAVRQLSFQLSGAQLGITICSLSLGFVAQPVIADVLDPPLGVLRLPEAGTDAVAAILALLLATIAQMLFGELVPQNLAISRPLSTALVVTPFQAAFSRVLRPVIALFNNTANAIVRRLGVEPREELRATRTPGELASLIRTSAEQGTLPSDVAAVLRRTLRLGERTAGDVMTPRIQIVSLDVRQSAADLVEATRRHGISRFPVRRHQVDDIVGVVHVKQAFAVPRSDRSGTLLDRLMVDPMRVPESLRCDDLLRSLRAEGLQLAIVIDEYGGTAGVITVEDLVEELVGQVRDEHDPVEEPDVIPLSDGGWSVSGLLRRDELTDQLGFIPPTGPYDTVAGLVLYRHRQLPTGGEMITEAGWTFTVTRMDGRRIDRIRVQAPAGNDR